MEVLAPSGNYQSALAALLGGADAIYLGGKAFSARMSAENFTNEELERIVNLAHSVCRKVFVTLNTMLFQDEFMEAVEFARFLASIHVDGVIVQDLGLAHYLHITLPSLPLHASTQINCHNLAMAKALKQIGFVRVVLAREADASLIRKIKNLGLEVEIFVHGALCVCYSGNCLLSSFIGGRSGNRGRCAQPCRMRYDLQEDGQIIQRGAYEISTKDLMTLNQLSRLKDTGVDSLKIEGRLKGDEYIYSATKAYRHAVDALEANETNSDLRKDQDILQQVYSRGFTKGYMFGESPFALLNQQTSSHQGERIGRAKFVKGNRVAIYLEKEIHRLDGIRFNNESQIGLTVERLFLKGQPKEVAYQGQTIEVVGVENANRVKDAEVIRTTNYALKKQIEDELRGKLKMPISGTLYLSANKPMGLQAQIGKIKISVEGPEALPAENGGTPIKRIKEQLAKSGDYPYYFSNVKIIGPDCFVPISSLNQIRNAAYEKLYQALVGSKEEIELLPYESTLEQKEGVGDIVISSDDGLAILAKNDGMSVFKLGNKENRFTERIDEKGDVTGRNVYVNYPVMKAGQTILIASPYCNIANSYSLDCYFDVLGFDACLASLEMDQESIRLMVDDFRIRHGFLPNLGVQIYGKVDLMIMKSCPIGTHFGNKGLHCNRCHVRRYELIDKAGAHYHLLGDSICTTHVLSERPLCLFEKMDSLKEAGVSFGLLTFTDETLEEAQEILDCYHFGNSPENVLTSKGHYEKRAL